MRSRSWLCWIIILSAGSLLGRDAASQAPPLRIAAVDWSQEPGTPYRYDRGIRVGISPASAQMLRRTSVRVRLVRGSREQLRRLRPDRDSCVTLAAYSYPVEVYSTGIKIGVKLTASWLGRTAGGLATGENYLVFLEFGSRSNNFIRIRHSDLARYLDSGLPIVITPPSEIDQARRLELGRSAGGGSRPFPVVPTCLVVAEQVPESILFAEAACADRERLHTMRARSLPSIRSLGAVATEPLISPKAIGQPSG